MKRTLWQSNLALLALLIAMAPALAQGPAGDRPPPGGPGPHGGPPNAVIGMAGRAIHELDLSRDQRDQLHEIVRGYMEGDLGQQLQAVHDARRALELLVWDSASVEGDLIAASQSAADATRQLELLRHRLALDVLNVLTEEQREAFKSLLAAGPTDMDRREGYGGPGGFEGRRGRGPHGH